jgi:hypothetical protein
MEQREFDPFFNLYRHGFIRAAVCIPTVKVADTRFNAGETIRLAREAAAQHACLTLFPELGLSAYSNEDLFHQDALLKGVLDAIEQIVRETAALNMILVVGAPLEIDSRLFNCGIVLYRGRILGLRGSPVPRRRRGSRKDHHPLRTGRDPLRSGPHFRGDQYPPFPFLY